MAELRGREQDVVYRYSIHDPWKRRLFAALCRRYGLSPYTERGRRHSTVLVRAPKTFHDRTLHPEFIALSDELETQPNELTERVIREAIHEDATEAAEDDGTKALPPGAT